MFCNLPTPNFVLLLFLLLLQYHFNIPGDLRYFSITSDTWGSSKSKRRDSVFTCEAFLYYENIVLINNVLVEEVVEVIEVHH